MFKKAKGKIRAVIRSETKSAILEVKKANEKVLVNTISERVQQISDDARLQQNEQFKKVFQEDLLQQNEQFKKVFQEELLQQNKRLKKVVQDELRTSLSDIKAEAALSSVPDQLQQAIAENDPEKAVKLLTRFAKEKEKNNAKYLAAASTMRTAIYRSGNRQAFADAEKILFNLHSVDEFTHEQFADVFHFRFPVMQAASLTQQYVRRRRMKQIGNVPDRWLPHDKEAGLLFADMTNVKHARTVFDIRIEDITPKADIVIKPMVSRGSIGAYLVKDLDNILVPRDQIILKSWDEMLAHANDLVKKGLIENAFMEQDMIYADKEKKIPAHDLKIYTFYGEIGCVNEIAREPGLAYWWYAPDGTPINLKIQNPPNSKAMGFTQEHLEIAAELSKRIPAPHMRIDFLLGEDGLYLSEFCSQTGSQVETIIEVVSPGYNRSFGNMYLKAEMRIMNDLLDGKRFDEINEFNRIYDERYKNQ